MVTTITYIDGKKHDFNKEAFKLVVSLHAIITV